MRVGVQCRYRRQAMDHPRRRGTGRRREQQRRRLIWLLASFFFSFSTLVCLSIAPSTCPTLSPLGVGGWVALVSMLRLTKGCLLRIRSPFFLLLLLLLLLIFFMWVNWWFYRRLFTLFGFFSVVQLHGFGSQKNLY